jgi:hypothetical protein
MELANINWMGVGLTVLGLAVGWTLLRVVLRLTMQVFACGCLVLLVLVGGVFTYVYWEQLAALFQ